MPFESPRPLTLHSPWSVYRQHISQNKQQAEFLLKHIDDVGELTVTAKTRLESYAAMDKVRSADLSQYREQIFKRIRRWKSVKEVYTRLLLRKMDDMHKEAKEVIRDKVGVPVRRSVTT